MKMNINKIKNLLLLRGRKKGNIMDDFIEGFVGLIIIVVLVTFGSTMSSVMFQEVSPTISSINNTTIRRSINGTVANSLGALKSSTNYIGILGLTSKMLLFISIAVTVIMIIRAYLPANNSKLL